MKFLDSELDGLPRKVRLAVLDQIEEAIIGMRRAHETALHDHTIHDLSSQKFCVKICSILDFAQGLRDALGKDED